MKSNFIKSNLVLAVAFTTALMFGATESHARGSHGYRHSHHHAQRYSHGHGHVHARRHTHAHRYAHVQVRTNGRAEGSRHGQSGIASMYTTAVGTRTASGRPLHNGGLTAAHRTLAFGTRVRVTNRRNGRSVVVTITDRGPFVRGRVIDLTLAAANAIGMGRSVAPVSLQVL